MNGFRELPAGVTLTAKGVSFNRTVSPAELMQVAEVLVSYRIQRETCFAGPNGPANVTEYCIKRLSMCDIEKFGVIFLDNGLNVIGFDILAEGTIAATTVFPREVVRKVIENNAAAVIFTHNHPTGSLEASRADIQLTEMLKKALATIDVRVIDHIIVGGNAAASMALQGLM